MSAIVKQLNATSEMLVRASKQIDKRIAEHLVNIAKHINGIGNGDVSTANYFFSLISDTSGIRRDAIGNWLMTYAGCSWNADKKRFGRRKNFVFDLEAAVREPWYMLTPQKEFKPFDLEKALQSLIKKAHKALEDFEHEGEHKVKKQLLSALELISDGHYTIEDDGQQEETPTPEGETKSLEQAPLGWASVEGGAGPNGHEEELVLTGTPKAA